MNKIEFDDLQQIPNYCGKKVKISSFIYSILQEISPISILLMISILLGSKLIIIILLIVLIFKKVSKILLAYTAVKSLSLTTLMQKKRRFGTADVCQRAKYTFFPDIVTDSYITQWVFRKWLDGLVTQKFLSISIDRTYSFNENINQK